MNRQCSHKDEKTRHQLGNLKMVNLNESPHVTRDTYCHIMALNIQEFGLKIQLSTSYEKGCHVHIKVSHVHACESFENCY